MIGGSMQLLRTNKDILDEKDILTYIEDYERNVVPFLDTLWKYYQGKNTRILNRKIIGAPNSNTQNNFNDSYYSTKNTPDNLIPIPFGRKIIRTFTGYAYRPKYISYKPIEIKQETELANPMLSSSSSNNEMNIKQDFEADKELFLQIMKNFRLNNESIKTARAGRNTGIFGVSYELLYTDGAPNKDKLSIDAVVKFITIDPRELILLYNYDSEPKKVAAIRFYSVELNKYIVEVYYPNIVKSYIRVKDSNSGGWLLLKGAEKPNFFNEVPVVPYYFGDEIMGLIEPIIPLIDCYDALLSDSMNEFDRFANAYLVMKKFGLTNPLKKKEEGVLSAALANLKRYRIFENLDKDADVKFLTKDIPYGFIDFMTKFVQKEIHTQSHVPDFAGEKFSGASGIAIQRLLFDFENVCADAEADFDVALYDRMRLITSVLKSLKIADGDYTSINIAHKRNSPLNLLEFANTALILKNAGFSRYLIADIMPDDVVPDVEEELARQDEDMERMLPTLEQNKVGADIFNQIDANQESAPAQSNPGPDQTNQVPISSNQPVV